MRGAWFKCNQVYKNGQEVEKANSKSQIHRKKKYKPYAIVFVDERVSEPQWKQISNNHFCYI